MAILDDAAAEVAATEFRRRLAELTAAEEYAASVGLSVARYRHTLLALAVPDDWVAGLVNQAAEILWSTRPGAPLCCDNGCPHE